MHFKDSRQSPVIIYHIYIVLETFWYGPDQHPYYDVIVRVKELNESRNIFYD